MQNAESAIANLPKEKPPQSTFIWKTVFFFCFLDDFEPFIYYSESLSQFSECERSCIVVKGLNRPKKRECVRVREREREIGLSGLEGNS